MLWKNLLVAAVCLLGLAAVGQSQVATGTINVEVLDSSGGVMAGAEVTLIHVASGQQRAGTTSGSGIFRAAFMPIGEYSIRVGSVGFGTKNLGVSSSKSTKTPQSQSPWTQVRSRSS